MAFKIYGTVEEKESGRVLPGLIIKPVLDSRRLHSRFSSLLGETNTHEHGEFVLTYKGEEYKFLFQNELMFYLEIFTTRQEQPIHKTECRQFTANGGERFDIAIPREELIRSYPRENELPDIESTVASMEHRSALNDAVEAKVQERVKVRMAKVNKRAEAARKAFSNFSLSRLSSEQQKEATYLRPGDDLAKAQREVMEQDLKRMAELPITRGIPLSLSENDIEALGLESEGGTIGGTVQMGAIKDRFPELIPRGEITANTEFVTDCWTKAKAEKAVEEATGGEEEPHGPDEEPPGAEEPGSDASELTSEQLVLNQIAVQMKDVTAPEGEVQCGIQKLADQDKVQKTIIKCGPADVTAYHDFYDLQIAFRHVWTEVFDEGIPGIGEELYQEYVKLKEYEAEDGDENIVESPDQLRQLILDLRRSSIEVAAADDRYGTVREYLLPSISAEQWAMLHDATKSALFSMANEIRDAFTNLPGASSTEGIAVTARVGGSPEGTEIESAYKKYAALHEKHAAAAKIMVKGKSRIENMLEDLEERLSGKYVFDVFAANSEKISVNFGILVNYRQKWEPLNYQVGELVSTIPLAPKEVRRYAKKRVAKKSRAVKEVENALQIKKEDSSDTYRDQAEITRRATNKTNFKHNAEGGVNFKTWNAKADYGVTIDTAKHSSQIKKEFREAILKAAQEYRQENKLEISSTSSEEYEESTSGEISNPNDEIPVTYLFYELQRVYEISEKIHKLTPVILVANEVPAPNEIDEDWLLAHDWILRRVILDDSYLPALDYLSDKFVGDEISAEVHRNNFETQLDVVRKITQTVSTYSTTLSKARKAMEEAINRYAETQVKEGEGVIESVVEGIFGGDEDKSELYRIQMETAKENFERLERQERELRSRLEREVTALESATEKYSTALQEQFNRRTEILRLRVHVKDNILYYIQAIWDQEPPDQRFFRLYDKTVPDFTIKPATIEEIPAWYDFGGAGNVPDEKPFVLLFYSPAEVIEEERKLVEVADLDNLQGYKGNYMIFPLKENNTMTLFMMQSYLDKRMMGTLWDPDELSNYTIEQMKEIIKCYYELYPDAFTDEVKEKYRDLLIKKLMDPYPEKEIVTVPTDSLYIEALPGTHSILEDFKLIHRAVDVKKAQSEVRHAELENIRLAARALTGEYGDPDIERKVVIEGASGDVDVSTG